MKSVALPWSIRQVIYTRLGGDLFTVNVEEAISRQ